MATIIPKEQIENYEIIPAFVDQSEKWQKELVYAVRLGNEHKGKVTFIFETTQGPVGVNTTVWSVDDRFLQIKGGQLIPLKSIIDIQFQTV